MLSIFCFAFSLQGEAGVLSVLDILNEELKHAMLFSGTARLADIGCVNSFPCVCRIHGAIEEEKANGFSCVANGCVPSDRNMCVAVKHFRAFKTHTKMAHFESEILPCEFSSQSLAFLLPNTIQSNRFVLLTI